MTASRFLAAEYEDRPIIGPDDVARTIGVTLQPSGRSRARFWAHIVGSVEADRGRGGRPEALWKIFHGRRTVAGLFVLRNGVFHACNAPWPMDARRA